MSLRRASPLASDNADARIASRDIDKLFSGALGGHFRLARRHQREVLRRSTALQGAGQVPVDVPRRQRWGSMFAIRSCGSPDQWSYRTAGVLCLAISSSALLLTELRSCGGCPKRPRTSPVSLRPDRLHRARMLNHALAVARAFLAVFACRADLILDNLALRQQLVVRRRKQPRPRLRASDRGFWLALCCCWPR
jgi:hypothetical protein